MFVYFCQLLIRFRQYLKVFASICPFDKPKRTGRHFLFCFVFFSFFFLLVIAFWQWYCLSAFDFQIGICNIWLVKHIRTWSDKILSYFLKLIFFFGEMFSIMFVYFCQLLIRFRQYLKVFASICPFDKPKRTGRHFTFRQRKILTSENMHRITVMTDRTDLLNLSSVLLYCILTTTNKISSILHQTRYVQ
jgi:hypothetical protein